MPDGFNRLLHEDRLVEKQFRFHLLRNIVKMSQQFADPIDNLNRVGIAALLQNRNIG